MTSRLGVRGEEDLGFAGLTASYNLEFAVDVLNGKGGNAEAGNLSTRLGWLGLGGDWGLVKFGTQWMPLFEFGGWNTHRTDTHGYGSYYYTTCNLRNSIGCGFRQDSAISYQYGSAWGHSDPFAFSVSLGIGEGDASSEETTEEFTVIDDDGTRRELQRELQAEQAGIDNGSGVSSVQVAGQYSIAKRLSVNAVFVREFNDFDRTAFNTASEAEIANQDRQLFNAGARWNVTEVFELAFNYTRLEFGDEDDNVRNSYALASFHQLNEFWSGHLGVSTGNDDRDESEAAEGREINANIYGFVKRNLSDRTNVRFEFEHINYEGGVFDDNITGGDATIAMLALQHNF